MRLFQSYEVKNLLTAVAIANEIPPEKHWNNKIPPKLFGFSKNLAKDNNWKNITKALATWIINNLSSNLDDNELEEKVSVIEEHKDFLNKFENPVEAFNAIRNTLEQGIKQDGVYIGTIHSAKGLEWNTVFIIGCEVGYLPHIMWLQ